ncbi:MAG: hypothetical protein ACLGHZ_06225 [Actinomycetes bacterium]
MSTELTLLTALLAGHTDRYEEARILDLLRAATAPELDEYVRSLDCAKLFASVDNHLIGPHNRAALRELLIGRLGDLSIEARANLAYGLQAGHTDRADEEAIRSVFFAHAGAELTALKNQLNARTDAHDLEGLIFRDIDDNGVRTEILDHIAREASGVQAGEAKVLCDIDDTVVCALHDDRYPKGTIYPGILALLDAFDRGPTGEAFSLGDLTFVTARPGDAFGLIENHTRETLRRAGVANHSVLTGTFVNLLTHDLMAGRKIANIDHLRALYPEYRLLFIGDSGQGDVRVAELMWQRFGDVVDVVFIHDVVATPLAERERLSRERIEFVDTYVGAGVLAFERALIAEVGLVRIIEESLAALDEIAWQSPEQERATRSLFERDLDAARALGVRWNENPPPVPPEDIHHTPAPEPDPEPEPGEHPGPDVES